MQIQPLLSKSIVSNGLHKQPRFGIHPQKRNLFNAIAHEDLASLQRILTNGREKLDITQLRDKDGQSPLHWATLGDKPKVVRLFLEQGADPNVTSRHDHRTPLHLAAMYGLVESAEELLQLNANPNARDAWNQTPLHWAVLAKQNVVKLLQRLLASQADLNATDIWGQTPLHYVARDNHLEAAKALLAAGAKSIKNHDLKTPLDIAIKGNHLEMARLLAQQAQSPFRGVFTLLMNKIVP